jgi:hypothetical protein
MLKFLRDRAAINEHARNLVQQIGQYVPPGDDARNLARRRRSAVSIARRVATSVTMAGERPLGVLAKAQFVNRVKWGLRELEYPEEFIDTVTFEVVLSLENRLRGPTSS